MSEDHSLGSFIARNKTAIITTVAAATTVIGAGYYYYTNVLDITDKSGDSDSDATNSSNGTNSALNKKKKKKQQYKQKKKLEKQAENAAISGTLEEQEDNKNVKDASKQEKSIDVDLTKLGVPFTESGEVDITQLTTQESKDKLTMKLKEKGNALFKNKQYDDAIRLYSLALDIKEDPVFYSNRSACYVSLGDYEKVVEDCTSALNLKRDYSKCLLRRASAYELLGQYSDAMFDISALSLMGEYNNESIDTMLERVLNKQIQKILENKLSNQGESGEEHDDELNSYSDISSFFSSLPKDHSLRNIDSNDENDVLLSETIDNLYSQTRKGLDLANENFNKCVSIFESKLENDKTNESLKERLAISLSYQGILYFFKNKPTKAYSCFEKSLELFPTVNAYVFFALLKADKGTSTEVFECFDKAIELDPKNAAPYYHRAQLYFVTNDLEKAGADFSKAKELEPNHIFSHIQIACLTYKEGSLADAETLFSEAIRKFPTSSDLFVSYAEVLADAKNYEGAMKNLNEAIRLEEEASRDNVSANALITKANILLSNPTVENFIESSKLLELANEKSPKNFKAKISLGQMKLQEGDLHESLKLFEECVDLAMSTEDKYIAIKLQEGVKTQLRLREDPYLNKKIEELLAQYQMAQ